MQNQCNIPFYLFCKRLCYLNVSKYYSQALNQCCILYSSIIESSFVNNLLISQKFRLHFFLSCQLRKIVKQRDHIKYPCSSACWEED